MIRAIEDAGFDSIWTGDHFLYRMADGSAEGPWDAWSVLAAAAAMTSRVALGPLVTPVGFYNPAVLAKKAATVDEISGGRLVLGLGAGWNEVEFRGYGVPFDHRSGASKRRSRSSARCSRRARSTSKASTSAPATASSYRSRGPAGRRS